MIGPQNRESRRNRENPEGRRRAGQESMALERQSGGIGSWSMSYETNTRSGALQPRIPYAMPTAHRRPVTGHPAVILGRLYKFRHTTRFPRVL